jgi:hypothetical protein
MTSCDAGAVPKEASGLREVWALKQAVELLGFDADALVRRMCESAEPYWQRLALQSASVLFDPSRAYVLEPSISPTALVAADAWLSSVRLPGAILICGIDGRPCCRSPNSLNGTAMRGVK